MFHFSCLTSKLRPVFEAPATTSTLQGVRADPHPFTEAPKRATALSLANSCDHRTVPATTTNKSVLRLQKADLKRFVLAAWNFELLYDVGARGTN